MDDCCIEVTALLECFKWTLNKLENMTGSMAFLCLLLTMLSMPNG